MKTIQIAPYTEDCKTTYNSISGTMCGRKFIYKLNPTKKFASTSEEEKIKAFQMAIAMLSKRWQIEEVLNKFFNSKTGQFMEE